MNAHRPNVTLPILPVILSLVFLMGPSNATDQKTSNPQRPNIVFVLADDLGYGELGCYGQEKIKTPHIDRLASGGLRFMHHYSGAPVCAPSRCVLMTGQHLGHAEIRGNRDSGNGRIYPGQWPISDQIVTIAEVLQGQGYRTGAFGKWGLGPSNTSGSAIRQGFDRFYGYNCQRNAHSYYPPFLDSDEKEVRINKYPIPGHDRKPQGEVVHTDYQAKNYAPDLILKEALSFIDSNHQQPFFLYLPFVEPHVAMQPPQAWLDAYPQEWDAKGVYRGQNGYLPHDRPRAAYAAMISDLDEHVGTIVSRLEKHGLLDNTLIVFTSDNGPTHPSRDPEFSVGGADCQFFNSAGGLRGFKGSCYEGGIRVPCIASFPGKIEAGTSSDFPSYFPDWFPTLAAAAGAGLPDQQLDGVDLMPLLQGGKLPSRNKPLVWDFRGYGGIVAVRDGDWKAVRRKLNKPRANSQWELYNLGQDRAETEDVAAKYPEIVAKLEKAWLDDRTIEPDFPNPWADPKSSTAGGAR